MSPSFAGSKRPLEMVVYDPAAAAAAAAQQRANKRPRQEDATTSSSAAAATAMVPFAAAEPLTVLDVAPINAVAPKLPRAPPPPASREEPPCLRKHLLEELGLRANLPVHFIDNKVVTSTDLDSHQNRFRLPGDGVKRRLRAMLTPQELYDANLLHDPTPKPRSRARQPEPSEPQHGAAEGEEPSGQKIKKPKKTGKVHGGLPVRLVDLSAGAKELLMSRWESSHGTIVKGGGYLDFIRRCSFKEGDAVEIWAFVQRRFRLLGEDIYGESLLHLLVVKKGKQQPWCRCCHPLPPAPAVNPSTELVLA